MDLLPVELVRGLIVLAPELSSACKGFREHLAGLENEIVDEHYYEKVIVYNVAARRRSVTSEYGGLPSVVQCHTVSDTCVKYKRVSLSKFTRVTYYSGVYC